MLLVFARLEQLQLASALLFVSTNTVIRLTCTAHCKIANAHFDRRNERLNELILTDRTDVLAEAGALEETVNDDRGLRSSQSLTWLWLSDYPIS